MTRLFSVHPRRATLWKLDPEKGSCELIVDLEEKTATLSPILTPEEWGALTTVGG